MHSLCWMLDFSYVAGFSCLVDCKLNVVSRAFSFVLITLEFVKTYSLAREKMYPLTFSS